MITSSSNQRLKTARQLLHHRRRGSGDPLLIGGVRLIRDALQSGARPSYLFYIPHSLTTNPALNLLVKQVEQMQIECLPCTPAAFATLSTTVTPQGIAAVFPLPVLPLPPALTFTLVLDQVRDPGNAGTLLRSAEAAGVELVIFAADTVDPFNDKVLRAGMGAHFRLPVRTCTQWDEVRQLVGSEPIWFLASATASQWYDQVNWRQPSVLVIGGEASGASPAAHQSTQAIAIPMQGPVESLNAGIAGAVILFEAARQRRFNDSQSD
jgi:TrmH family RNA methyltransferase